MSVSWLESSTGAACVAAGATASALALVLAVPTLARRFSRVTRRAAQDDERVLVRCGGLALACGVAAASAFAGEPRFALAPWLTERAGRPVELAPLGAIVAALALGALDDLLPRGLSAGAKLAGQLAVGGVLAWPLVASAQDGTALGLAMALVVAAAVAQNALNTFDNADGAAGGLALCALGASAFPWSGALLGFLAFNLPWRGRTRALLGDAGSHALGVAFLATPAAWPALALPLFDLARVVLVRRSEGRSPWRGDRAHLAHRLQGIGFRPFAVAASLVGIAGPSVVLGALAASRGTVWHAFLGIAGTALLFWIALGRIGRAERRAARAGLRAR